jgi:hypothetical protein
VGFGDTLTNMLRESGTQRLLEFAGSSFARNSSTEETPSFLYARRTSFGSSRGYSLSPASSGEAWERSASSLPRVPVRTISCTAWLIASPMPAYTVRSES